MAKHVVDSVDAIPPGTTRCVEVEGRRIAVFNVAGSFYALRDICPHQGAQLSAGKVVGAVTAPQPGCYEYEPGRPLVKCPWHGWEFELGSGQSWWNPERERVRPYPVSVERLPGPYVAETVSVSTEDDYVVIEV